MATVELTERQKQVKEKLEEGKKAPQIAQELGITANAVYQTISRMREMGGAKPSGRKTRKAPAKATAPPKPKPAPTPAPNPPIAAIPTPLQALKLRKDAIDTELKGRAAEVDAAQRVLDRAKDVLTKATEKHGDELKRIENAMAVLRGEKNAVAKPSTAPAAPAAQKPPSRSKGSGKGSGKETPEETPAETPEAGNGVAPSTPPPAEAPEKEAATA